MDVSSQVSIFQTTRPGHGQSTRPSCPWLAAPPELLPFVDELLLGLVTLLLAGRKRRRPGAEPPPIPVCP